MGGGGGAEIQRLLNLHLQPYLGFHFASLSVIPLFLIITVFWEGVIEEPWIFRAGTTWV